MRRFAKLTWTEMKLFGREPGAVFFMWLLPLGILLLAGLSWGNWAAPDQLGPVDVLVPGLAAYVIANAGLFTVVPLLAGYRQAGYFRRLHVTPLPPRQVLAADLLVILALTALSLGVIFAVARAAFGLKMFGSPASVATGLLFCTVSFCAFGFVLGGLVGTVRTAQIVTMALFIPMLMFSGMIFPRAMMRLDLQYYAEFVPLTHVVDLLRGLWAGDAWAAHAKEASFLGAMTVVAAVVSKVTFRWE